MSRWLDADEIENAKFQEENLRGMGEHIAYRVGWNEAIESILENAPTIDIVRCGECKRANYELSGVRCGLSDVLMGEDGFCSIGEREGE